jgi:hypothetical protein
MLIGACGFALAACGGSRMTVATGPATTIAHPKPGATTVITGPTTTTIAHAKAGAVIRCEANGTRLRAEIPASGEVNKSVGGYGGGTNGAISLVIRWQQDSSVVVSCKR